MTADDVAKLVIRLPPRLHRRLRKEAARSGVSLNTLMISRLERASSGIADDALETKLETAARLANRSVAEETEHRLELAFAWEAEIAGMKAATARHEQMLKAGGEAYLRQQGYLEAHGVEGSMWFPPGTKLTGKFTALDPAIVRAITSAAPEIAQAIAAAVLRIYEDEKRVAVDAHDSDDDSDRSAVGDRA